MPRYAAFLRAVNLGSERRADSAALRSHFEEMGFVDVATFRTSGNVVFEGRREPPAKLTERIEKGLAEALGFDVVVFLRSASEVRVIAEYEPFDRDVVEAAKGKLQVTMLAAKPTAQVRKEALVLETDEDRLAFGDRELYWLPNGGTQKSALDQRALAKLLGPTTMRTKATIEQLAAKYFA